MFVLKIFGRMHKFVESFYPYAVPIFSGLVLIGHKNLNTVTLIKVCGRCLISVSTEEKSKQSVAMNTSLLNIIRIATNSGAGCIHCYFL